MSAYQFPCPNCSQSISLTDDRAGQTMQCPTCKREFIVPKPAGPAAPPAWQGGGDSGVPPIIDTAAPPVPLVGTSELERQVLEGGRFVIFQYCFSVLVMTFKRPSPLMFLRGDEDGARHAVNYSLISLAAGWWGIPWGPIWTIATVISNARGGKDLTAAVLTEKLGPARAAQIMAQRRPPSPKGAGLKAFRWSLAGAGMLLALMLAVPIFPLLIGGPTGSQRARRPGEAQFELANKQVEMYRGSAAFGNTPKAVAVADRFSSNLKKLREVFFEQGKAGGLSLTHHEFLTCCELQDQLEPAIH